MHTKDEHPEGAKIDATQMGDIGFDLHHGYRVSRGQWWREKLTARVIKSIGIEGTVE